MYKLGTALSLALFQGTAGGAPPPSGVTPTSVGSMVSSLTDVTMNYGAGATAGNVVIGLTESANQGPAVAGMDAALVNYGLGTAGAAGATRIDVVYKQSISGTDITNGHLISGGGDHNNGVLLTFTGHSLVTAPNWIAASQSGTATTSISMTQSNGVYTDVKAGDLLLVTIATDNDTDTNLTISSISWGNVAGTSSVVHNDTDSTGTGGGIIVVQLRVTADATAGVTFDATITSTIYSAVMLHIKGA